MGFEEYSKFAFLNENQSETIINKSLEHVSLEEIKSLKNRINFHLAHYMILARRNKVNANDIKIDFLKKLDDALNTEIKEREKKYSI